MRFSSIAFSSLLLAGVFAAPSTRAGHEKGHTIHEKRNKLPVGWRRSAKLEPASTLPLRIALTQRGLDKAEEYLLDVSHPKSPNFGKHWSADRVAKTFAPAKESVDEVAAWLSDAGINDFSQSQSLGWIYASVTVEEVERLLKTSYYEYVHGSGTSHIACESYSIPEHLRSHIDFITPTVHFDARVSQPKKRDVTNDKPSVIPNTANSIGSSSVNVAAPKSDGEIPWHKIITELKQCDKYITPDCLRVLYEFPPDFPNHPDNSYGVVEYTPQAFLQDDLNIFFANYSPPLVGAPPIIDLIDGGVLQTIVESFSYNGESDLDLQYAMSLVYPQNVTLYQVGDLVEGASFNNFLDAIDGSYCTANGGDDPNQDGTYPDPNPQGYQGPENCGGFAATNVISTSYSFNEADLTSFYEHRQCNEYMKLGLQGVTILYSSGDYGVAGNSGKCIDTVTGNYTGAKANYGKFNPSFPGTCPYVTSVGATQVAPNKTVTQPEKAAESVIFSGGGFSNVFAMPEYQKEAVERYFAKHNPPYGADRYNNSMMTRGYPDISANGVNYVVAVDGNFSRVFGTSASSPTVGAILTLVNSARLFYGKSPIGFINPTIYEYPWILNDITMGGNQGCGTPGFMAVPGWDPVTGLGTPNFPRMLEVWLELP